VLEATGADGEVVWRTMLTSVFRGVDLRGDPASVDVGWPTAPAAHPDGEHAVAIRTSLVRPVDAHVYTECARIWNPIHTDVAIARAAGLADPILHGTATLSRAVSVCAELTEVPLVDVRRVGATFAAPVALGSTIEIRLLSHHDGVTSFDVINDQGRPAIRHGYLETQPVGLPQDRGRSIDHTARGFD
jgi:acyl dehydratase